MPDFDPVLEQKLADLSDEDWSALTARVRPPTSAAQLRDVAGKLIGGDALEAFIAVANLKALSAANGDIDETKVVRALSTMFGVPADSGPTHRISANTGRCHRRPAPATAGKRRSQRPLRAGRRRHPTPPDLAGCRWPR